MKEISELNLPDTIRYTSDHEWAKQDGEMVLGGINDYAQDQLGEIVFVELPEVGASFSKGDEFGTVESVKAVSEMFMPVSGTIEAVNQELENSPEYVNTDPYGKGWIIKVKPLDMSELDSLLDKDAYLALLKG